MPPIIPPWSIMPRVFWATAGTTKMPAASKVLVAAKRFVILIISSTPQ
jgi:hypothetical protein